MNINLVNRLKKIKAKTDTNLGFGTQTTHQKSKSIKSDGTFNVKKIGLERFSLTEIYHELVTMSWTKFFILIGTYYILSNLVFTVLYLQIGIENLAGVITNNDFDKFFEAFFFSAQTLTSVGYGRVNPLGISANVVSSIQSLIGLMSFAVITGLLYAKFASPEAKIKYSNNALISPFKNGKALMFRILNARKKELVEVEAFLIISLNNPETNNRDYYNVRLERSKINFFPLSWTIVHPIDDESPLNVLEKDDYKKLDLELLVNIKGFDEISCQTVFSRYSYLNSDIVWDAKFKPDFETINGNSSLFIDRINDYTLV